jgi:hypothetical protein
MAAEEKVAAPAPGTPEYDAAMVAKFEGYTKTELEDAHLDETPPAAATRPEHIPEKFWDGEKGEVRLDALVKSYSELEKSRATKVTPAEKAEGTGGADKATPEVTDADAAKAAVAEVGLDYEAMRAEFLELGTLSEETYKTLEAKGIPQTMVDAYIAGQQALAAQWDNTGYEVAGGKEAFQQMAAWAATALTAQEAKALNEAFSGKDTNVDKMKLAVAGLRAKYEAANGKAPSLLGGTPASSNQGYQSRAQMTADMKDPKYSKDPAFRQMVENKLAATTAF